nr:MAG TPA: holin [Caudoviricetes sp.]
MGVIPMWQFILEYWAEWAFGLLGGAFIAVVAKYKAMKEGLLAILHDRIYQACQHYLAQGNIDTPGLKNIEYLYRSYHTLGGNGTGTELYNRCKALPIHDTDVWIQKGRNKTMSNTKISAGTIARTACLLLALTNQVLSALGKPVLPIESETVEQLVTAGITTVAALVAWWKNNSFTRAALEGDKTYDRVKKSGY